MKTQAKLVIGACILMFSWSGNGWAESPILVKPTSTSTTGLNDIAKLKQLASGVGWEFDPDAETNARLKGIGIKTIRCINVEPSGHFDSQGFYVIDNASRLLANLETCRTVGATPHIIIAQRLPPELCTSVEDIPLAQRGVFGNQTSQSAFGPTDWGKYQEYCKAIFKYVLIDQKFPDARFEVGNEPDLAPVFTPLPPAPARGSREAYEAYLTLYKNVAAAATSFEKEHPGIRVTIGGPGGAWGYTFRFGSFNWPRRFLRDCGEQKLKLDFVGLHYYGNVSSLDGEYEAVYPSFTATLKDTKEARDQYCPGVPLCLTEWGPSYITSNEPDSVINGNNVGAAFIMTFLNKMLECGIDRALYLVTTDGSEQGKDGKSKDIWGWPSLFVNPKVFGKAYPKAPFHVFEMISRLEGSRVEATRGEDGINCIASADPKKKRITLIVWNYNSIMREQGVPVELASQISQIIRIRDATAFFGSRAIHMKRWLVSETLSNAYDVFVKEGKVDGRSELQQVDEGQFAILNDQCDFGFSMPPSSVAFVTLEAQD